MICCAGCKTDRLVLDLSSAAQDRSAKQNGPALRRAAVMVRIAYCVSLLIEQRDVLGSAGFGSDAR